jgi:1-deoxy-D-xylulose-5-phosphate synthase
MADHGYNAKVVRLGIPDKFIHHGTQEELYDECGYDKDGIVKEAMKLLPHYAEKAQKLSMAKRG